MSRGSLVFYNVLILILLVQSQIFAAGLEPVSIAIEFQSDSKFSGVIGKAYVTETTIELVTFAEQDGKIIPFAWIYQVTN